MMKVSLERVDTRGLLLELPGTSAQTVTIASTEDLRGTIAMDADKTTLSGVQAESVVLSSLRLLFGALVLSAASGATLRRLAVSLDRAPNHLALEASASSLSADELSIAIADVAVRGRVHLEGVSLVVRGEHGGSLSAESVALEGLSLRTGEVEIGADDVRGADVTISWGGRFGLRAGSLESPALRVVTPAARVVTSDLAVSAFVLDGTTITAGRATARSARVEATLASGQPSQAQPSGAQATSLFDASVLDALSGQLDVDVELDLTVPIIGRRRATHRLRVAIDEGAIDYLALERNLSALEDAILDFAVRDGGLALERVNPLFPARGRGKPIVLWPLDEAGLMLANQSRVRLSALLNPQVVGSDEPTEAEAEPKKSAVALRHLGLVNIGARLALAAPIGAARGRIRPKRLEMLSLGGNVYYDPGEATPPGLVRAEAAGLAVDLHDLSLGASALTARIELAKVSGLEVAFSDARPTTIQLDASELVVSELALRRP